MKKICLNKRGLSLIEVIVAAMVVSVLMAGLYAVYISAKNMTALALHKAVALAWASSKIEQNKNGMSGGDTDPADDNLLANEVFRGAGVTVATTNIDVGIRRHIATVTWDE